MKHGRDKKHRIKDHGILVVPRLGGELGYEEYLIFGELKKKKKMYMWYKIPTFISKPYWGSNSFGIQHHTAHRCSRKFSI